MSTSRANTSMNATPVWGGLRRAPLLVRAFWYWGYWFSVGVPAARSS